MGILRAISATLAATAFAAGAFATPAAAAELPVRFGTHPTFERIVFDWREAVEYKVDQQGTTAVISFDRVAEIDEKRLDKGLARLSSHAEVINDGTRLVLRLTLPERMQLRHFRSGTKVVLDFSRAAVPKPAAPMKAAPAADASAPAKPTPAAVAAEPAPKAPVPLAASPEPAVAPPPEAPAPSAAAQPAPAARKPIPLRPIRETPTKEIVAAAAKNESPAATAAPEAPAETHVPVELVRTPDGHGLRFGWSEPVGAAVFGRGPHLWIVFDRRAQFDLVDLRIKYGDMLGPIEVIEPKGQGQGAIVRLSPVGGTASAARREGNAWVVDIGRLPRAPDAPAQVAVRGQSGSGSARVLVEVPGARTILHLRDPEVGDEIAVAPTSAAGAGVDHERTFPQFRLLASAQGVAVQKIADDLTVRPAGTGIEISSDSGLMVSDIHDRTAPFVPHAFRPPRLFDLEAWRQNGPGRFNQDRQALHRAVAEAPQEKRNAARLELARFLFAYGHMEGAIGLLRLIEQEEPKLVATAQLRALRGVAALMSGDLDEAQRHLSHSSLDSVAEAALWRGALAMAQGDPVTARAQMGRSVDMYRTYPAPFANRLNLWHAEARLLTGDLRGAEAHLDFVAASRPTELEHAQATWLRGRLLLASGDRQGALAVWEQLVNAPPTPGRTAAMLDRIDLLREDGKMTPAEAIPILERLRFSWRGDALEFRVLASLGRMHLAVHDYRAGLTIMRKALTLYPKHRDAPRVTAEMASAFAAMYEDENAKLSPVAAIALYQEFRELIPSGPRGDEIARRLADQLIAVDLLDRAAEVLAQQVKTRDSPQDKARLGAKLAMVRLLDRKPEAAIAALKSSAAPDLAPELARERRHLEARALAELGRLDDAMQLLAPDMSAEADALRAELNWRAQNWTAAAAALGRLLGTPSGELEEEKARQAIRLAVALSLAGDRDGLRRFDARFGPAMQRTPFKDIYQVVTSEAGTTPDSVRDIAARTAAAAPFQSFLSDYRKRLLAAAPKAGG